MLLDLLCDLSTQEQEFLFGGQNIGGDPTLAPLAGLRGRPVAPVGRAGEIGGSETQLSDITIGGVTNSSPLGSIGNSNAQGQGLATGAEDIMILPPFFESNQTL
jgi:hypothetical protein